MEQLFMDKALQLAEKALGRTSPNPLVGAVVVKEGQIVGQGFHKQAGTAHAERIALDEAGKLAQGADLYVTLEPCNHYGRTPPCTKAIIEAGVKRVYVAIRDPNPVVAGKGIQALQSKGIEVILGLKAEEARKQNEVFLKYIQSGQPFIALKSACSLDGKIATRTGHSQWITGTEARNHGHSLRNKYDAIMVGSGTVIADNPSLNCRIHNGRDPIRIVVDSKLTITPEAKILNLNSPAPTILATTTLAPEAKMRKLAKKAQILIVNDGEKVDIAKLIKMLGEMKITSILVEGGATLNGSLLEQRVIDKYYVYMAPLIIGGTQAPGFVGGEGPASLEQALRLKDIAIRQLGEDILITGYPK